MPHRGKLYPITGINLYAIPIPEMVEQFKHSANDEDYPIEPYKALSKQRDQDTSFGSESPSSDTLPSPKVIPIFSR